MKYRVTPINVFVALAMVALLFVMFFSNTVQGGLYVAVYILPVLLFGLIIDFVMQLLRLSYTLLFIIELIVILAVLLLNTFLSN